MSKQVKRLAGPTTLGTAAATVYTVPSGVTTTAVARHIHFSNGNSSAVTISMSIGTDAAGTRVISQKSVAANDTYDWYGTITLATSEVLQAFASTAANVTVTVFGEELTSG